MAAQYKYLDRVRVPADLKQFSDAELKTLANELRAETIDAVSQTGGHLGAGLGVLDLTVALHAVFNAPEDKLIWDVGHQAYPHKILTGRRDRIRTLRKGGGLSGFTKRSESVYDPFGAAHSSTAMSAGLGFATARDFRGEDFNVICVVGDGAMSAGMAYEAMNNIGDLKKRMIVILNDNEMSIAPPVGALSRYLTRLTSAKPYLTARELGKQLTQVLPSPLRNAAKRAEEAARSALSHQGTLFEELGFYYLGPVDGHDLDQLLPILRNVRDANQDGPVLIHVLTEKGHGFAPAKGATEKCHAVQKYDPQTLEQKKNTPKAETYTKVYARTLTRLAERDERIVGITGAMPSGTGMDYFGQQHPRKMFDTGIAEQHAVTFAAGLAAEGIRPFVTIYSTFLQRGYDQVVHDVAIQNLPVRFAMDRAGLVGADGQTHAGAFDIAYLGCLPNFTLMAAADEAELARMTVTAAHYDDGPIAFRYPRGEGIGLEIPQDPDPLPIGKGRILRDGKDLAFLSYGGRLYETLKAAEQLEAEYGISAAVADARFAKPLDTELIDELAACGRLITIEEGARGGFGSFVLHYLSENGLLDHGNLAMRSLHLPDIFQDHDAPENQYAQAGLDADGIIRAALKLTGSRRLRLNSAAG